MKKELKIGIVAGGTGGHIFPAISLSEQLLSEGKKIIFFSDTRVSRITKHNVNLFKNKNINLYTFNISKNFFNFVNYFRNFLKIFVLLKKENPKIIVGFGGYTSIPLLIAAKLLFKPIVLHEQNIVIGSTNKFFLPFSKRIIFGLGDKNKKKNNKKFFFVRNPVRKKVLFLRKKIKFNFNKKKINILIFGGSQGANLIDHKLPKAINSLPILIKKKINIYHQCSKKNLEFVKKEYQRNNITSYCKTFFFNLPEIIFKSQFVVSRSGASSLSEITALGKPALLIPYKFSKNNHQLKNAKWFVKNGCGSYLEENKLTENKLKLKIIDFIKNKKKIKKMSLNSFSLWDDKSLLKLSKLIDL